MAVTDLVETEEDDDDVGLEPRQIDALNKLYELGAEPRKDPTDPYDKSPKIRALQLIYEGRLGGPNRGQGRKKMPRASELLAERLRKKVDRMENAIDRGLDAENEKVALDAVKTAIKIEHDEAALQVKEQQAEASLDGLSKEELIERIIEIASEATTEAAIGEFIDLPETEIEEAEVIPETSESEPTDISAEKPARSAQASRTNSKQAGKPGRRATTRSGSKADNPFTKTARRRPTD